MLIEMRVYLAKKILIFDSSYLPVVGKVVKEKVLGCKQAGCEYLNPSFDRQYKLRCMPYTLRDVLLEQYVQKLRYHPNAWLKASVPNLNRELGSIVSLVLPLSFIIGSLEYESC